MGASAANGLGQYIPVAVPDTVTYPGSDYYELAVREYTEQLHSDLPPTRLRGYVQLNRGTDAGGAQHRPPGRHPLPRAAHPRAPRPAGAHQVREPAAVRRGRRPVPARRLHDHGQRHGPRGRRRRVPAEPRVPAPARRAHAVDQRRLTVPVDHPGVGDEPLPVGAQPGQRPRHVVRRPRAAGARRTRPAPPTTRGRAPRRCTSATPRAPACSTCTTTPTASPGSASTRARRRPTSSATTSRTSSCTATPPSPRASRAVDARVAAGTVPAAELPLMIEDKTFVPSAAQLRTTDPTWDLARWGGEGGLWYPHVYMPNQDASGRVTPMGRWDYLPWYWTDYEGTQNGPAPNPLYGAVPSQPKENPGTPNLSAVPNAFHDTMLVNGTAYPYVKVGRQAYRLRILNACADRQLNLQLYYAVSERDRADRRRRRSRAADGVGRGAHAPGPVGHGRRLAGALAGRHAGGRRAGPPGRRTGAAPVRQRRRPPAAGGHAQTHAGRPRAPQPHRPGGVHGRVPVRGRRHDQGAVPGAGRARRRRGGLLEGPGRLQADPVQRRAGSLPQRGQPAGLLHRRPRPDGDRRRAGDAAGLRAQHAHRHAVPGGRPGGGAVRPRAARAGPAGGLRRGAGPRPGAHGAVPGRLRRRARAAARRAERGAAAGGVPEHGDAARGDAGRGRRAGAGRRGRRAARGGRAAPSPSPPSAGSTASRCRSRARW